MSEKHRAVVVGATGGVGRFLVRTLARDPRVEAVTAAVRRTRPAGELASFYLLEGEPCASKITEVVVDYDALGEEKGQGEGGEGPDPGPFANHTIGFSGLGIYTSGASSEEHFRRVEVTCNLEAAKRMRRGGVHSFSYLSGQGVTQTPSFLTPMFSRVKGEAERRLQGPEAGFLRANVVRPPGIFDRPPGSAPANLLESFMNRHLRFFLGTSLGVTAEDIAQAMVHSAIAAKPTAVWGTEDIKVNAREYRQHLETL